MRVFDFAMTIADLNNLVHLTAQSKDSQGRAYSAGFTNAGVYERQEAFANESDNEKTVMQVSPTLEAVVTGIDNGLTLVYCASL